MKVQNCHQPSAFQPSKKCRKINAQMGPEINDCMRGAWLPHPREIGKSRSKGWGCGSGGKGNPANGSETDQKRSRMRAKQNKNERRNPERPQQCKLQFRCFLLSGRHFRPKCTKKACNILSKNDVEKWWKMIPKDCQSRCQIEPQTYQTTILKIVLK